jgi:hypothetical protein
MSPVVTDAPLARPSVRPLLLSSLAAAVLLSVVAWVFSAVDGPSFVGSLTIRNATDRDLQVDVSPARSERVLSLGFVPGQSTARFERVADQGKEWRFHLSSAGTAVGSIDLTRDELEQQNWKVVLPADLRPTG